ncbi:MULTISPECIES: hypothetical protein [Bacillus]|uniref:hypothetical protein n=1 Tax=Bacillus TaxID=1386 RepID=UPI0039786F5B
MAHFWHDLGKAFSLRAVMMVLGDKLRAASIVEVVFSFDKFQNSPIKIKGGDLMNEVITAAIIAGIVSVVTGIITIVIQVKNARRTSIVDTISSQRIEWVNKMRDNFVEINDLIFLHIVKWDSLLRHSQEEKEWKDDFNFGESIATIRRLQINISLLVNPTEEYSKKLINEFNYVLLLLLKNDEFDKDVAMKHQKEIIMIQQVILKSEWSRTKQEIQKGKVLEDKEVKAIYTKKAKDLNSI